MRILLATYFMYPSTGGLNTYIAVLKKTLEAQGYTVDVLARKPGPRLHLLSEEINMNTLRKMMSKPLNHYYKKHGQFNEPYIIKQELDRYVFELSSALLPIETYDLIHAQDVVSTRALARVKPAHIPLVTTIHGLYSEERFNRGVIQTKNDRSWKYSLAQEYIGALSADKVIVLTNWMRQRFQDQLNISSHHFETIPNGMFIEEFTKKLTNKTHVHIPESKKFAILCPARLVAEKDHRTLIDALQLLKKEREDFICLFAGDGELREELEDYCREKEVQDVCSFLGNRNDIPELMNRSDLVVLPSLQENLPFTVMEAQVAGKPLIVSNAGGLPEMVHDGVTGRLFKKRDSRQLAFILKELMDHDKDRQLLGNNAKDWGRSQWSANTFCEKIKTVYAKALEQKKKEPRLMEFKGINRPTCHTLEFHRFFEKSLWKKIDQRLPSNYTIPDPAFIKSLTT